MNTMPSRRRFTLNSVTVFKRLALLAVALCLTATALRADVCVWRDPERTMRRIFPQARDYKTVTHKMTPARIAAIEAALGAPLESSERREFDVYEITGADGSRAGTVLALAGKGEYGAIEVVIGVDGSGRIAGTYIQRSRERTTKALQSPDFLAQFAGKTKGDAFDRIKPAAPEAVPASQTVAFVIRKMLVFHDVLTKQNP